MKRLLLGLVALALVFGEGRFECSQARADSLTGYYTQVASTDPDFGHGIAAGVVPGLVENQLGPNGLPVLSALGFTDGLGNAVDYNPTTHELLWWSPVVNPNVSFDANPVQTNSLPLSFLSNFFPTDQTSDAKYFRSVHWSGTFTLASSGQITLSLGSDDDTWVFIDKTLAIDDGGIKALTYVPNTISNLSAGTHTIDVFYDDRQPVQAGIELGSSVTLNPSAVPEPASLTTLGIGAVCLLGYVWRRRKLSLA